MVRITLFGCGAVGSQLALHLASEDIEFKLVDDDIVEENNIATSAFFPYQIGVSKATALANLLWRKAKCRSTATDRTMRNEQDMARQCENTLLAIDCFDNMEARRLTMLVPIDTDVLHVGVSREGSGSILWSRDYAHYLGAPRGSDTFCTHLAGRDIIRLTAVVAAHVVQQWLDSDVKESIIVSDRLTIMR